MDVSHAWRRMEAWLSDNAPVILENLNPPAWAVDVQKAEAALGVRLPPSLVAAYFVHDGESRRSSGMFDGWRWFSLKEVIGQNDFMIGIERMSAFGDYTPGLMIPIMEDMGGNMLYVETSADGKEETPVIEWWHERPTRNVRYPSFGHMLSHFAGRLEKGDYVMRHSAKLPGLIDRAYVR
jgi:cell wall assembly regulator SMI1